jgi:hypothetical protein
MHFNTYKTALLLSPAHENKTFLQLIKITLYVTLLYIFIRLELSNTPVTIFNPYLVTVFSGKRSILCFDFSHSPAVV